MKRLIHYPEKCIGCAYCVDADSFQWAMDENGIAVLLSSKQKKDFMYIEIFPDDEVFHQKLVDICPTKCILIK